MILLSMFQSEANSYSLYSFLIFLSLVLIWLNRRKKREEVKIDFIWTPQHSSHPDQNHYAFNFENSGWIRNPKKDSPGYPCHEIWMKQNGFINETSWDFVPVDGKKGSHRVAFYSKPEWEKWKNTPPKII